MRGWISPLLLLIFYACLQTFILPPDGFVVGDQGTKLLQTRATLAHGPFSPWIDGPSQDLDTELQYQEPFLLRRHSRHLVGVFPWIFPAVTAPFFKLFGFSGLYVIPALSIVVTFLAAQSLGRRLKTPAAGLASAWCAVAATPVLFYGAEFWEHAPAVALTTTAVALVAQDFGAKTGRTPSSEDLTRKGGTAPFRIRRHVLAGALLALAAAFRPEAALMLPGVAITLAVMSRVARGVRSAILALVGGFAFVTALTVPANIAVYGTAVPQHVSSNLAFGWARYTATRVEIIRLLLLPASHHTLFIVVAIVAVALAIRRGSSTLRVYGCHVLVFLFALIAVGIPFWQVAVNGVSVWTTMNPSSLAHTWVFLFAAVYVVALPSSGADRSVERYLLSTTMLVAAGSLLVMPHAGGSQWGPRFLLPAAPLAGVVASKSLDRFDLPRLQAMSVRLAGAVVLALSIVVQGVGLAVLAHDKAAHARIGTVTEALTEPGDAIVSDLFWFPELTSRLYPSRRLLFARSADDVTAIAARAARGGFTHMSVVTSGPESQYRPPPSIVVPDGAAFFQTTSHDIGVRSLRLYRYER